MSTKKSRRVFSQLSHVENIASDHNDQRLNKELEKLRDDIKQLTAKAILPKYSVHHLVNRCTGWSNESCNKKLIDNRLHIAWHQCFGNLPPHMQLEFVVNMNDYCMTSEVKWEVRGILTSVTPQEFYKAKAIRDWNKLLQYNT